MIHNLNVVHKKLNSLDRIDYYHNAHQFKTLKTSESSVAAFISEQYKELLKSATTKKDGLVLILNLVKECSGQMFSQEAPAWLQVCHEVLRKDEGGLQLQQTALAVVADLCHRSQHHPELGRNLAPLVSHILPGLLQGDLPLKPVLSTLISLMRSFPSVCLHHKTALGQRLLNILGNYNDKVDDVLKELGVAFSLLPQLRSANTDHSALFKTLLDQFLMTLQLTMKQLLEEESDLDHLLLQAEPLDLPEIAPDADDAPYRLSDRFCALASCLSTMIRRRLDPIVVPMEGLMSLASKMLLVSAEAPGVLKAQYEMLELLHTLAEAIRSGLLPWMTDLITDLIQVLGQAEQQGICVDLRVRIYQLLRCLGPYLAPFSSDLLPQLLADVTELPAEEPSRPAPGPRKRLRTEVKHMAGNPNTAVSDRQLVCGKALMVLDHLSISRTIPSTAKEKMCEVLIQQAVQPGKVYTDPNCRLQLYSVLDSLTSGCSNPVLCQAIQAVLQNGIMDPDLEVSFLCKKASSRTSVVRTVAPPMVKLPPPQDMQKYSVEVALADSDEEFVPNEEEDEEMAEEEEDEEAEMEYIGREQLQEQPYDDDKLVNNSMLPSSKVEANEKTPTYKAFTNRPIVKNGGCQEVQLDSSTEQGEGELVSDEEEMEEDDEEDEIIAEDGICEEIGTEPPSDQILPEAPLYREEEEEEEEVAALTEERDEEWSVRNLEASGGVEIELQVEQPAEILAKAEGPISASAEPAAQEEPSQDEGGCQPDGKGEEEEEEEEKEQESPDSPPLEKPVLEDGVSNGTEGEEPKGEEEELPPSKKPRMMLEEEEEDPIIDTTAEPLPPKNAADIIKIARAIVEEN